MIQLGSVMINFSPFGCASTGLKFIEMMEELEDSASGACSKDSLMASALDQLANTQICQLESQLEGCQVVANLMCMLWLDTLLLDLLPSILRYLWHFQFSSVELPTGPLRSSGSLDHSSSCCLPLIAHLMVGTACLGWNLHGRWIAKLRRSSSSCFSVMALFGSWEGAMS